MSNPVDSADTGGLQLQSLELDMKTLQRYREEDRKEFKDFLTLVTRNFVTMQKNFDKIQESFKLLLIDPDQEEVLDEHSAQGSVQPKKHQTQCQVIQPGRPKQLQASTPPSMGMPKKVARQVVGTVVLQDVEGKELNLDGTPKGMFGSLPTPSFTESSSEAGPNTLAPGS
ncbi:hypothetical protein D1007_33906 [Hordeum vulgare]|nr:hypothetical protein D1007_33906 [Hordeum vulgare]